MIVSSHFTAIFEVVVAVIRDVDPDCADMPITMASRLIDLGLGGDPIGRGELLDLKDRLEKAFGMTFSDAEIPEDPESVTVGKIVETIERTQSEDINLNE